MYNYEFVVWLEGYLDVCRDDTLTVKKLRIIRNHLNLVKAAEKEGLGPLNLEIYDMISQHIDAQSDERVLQEFKTELHNTLEVFFIESFPDGKKDIS
jgi:cobyrinic acid a,c-diamide synthase